MTKPTMELVEEYGHELFSMGLSDGNYDRAGASRCLLEANIIFSEIRQRLEAMERDAARYRALRDPATCKAHPELWEALTVATAEEFDAAIDAAMAEAKP